MSTAFVPPRPDQWEGPAQASGFTPPPVDSWEGPARGGRGGNTQSSGRGGRNPGGGQGSSGASDLKGNAVTDFLGGVADTTIRTVPAAVKSAARLAAGAVTGDPTAASELIVQPQIDRARKAKEAWRHGEHVQAVGNAMAAALPIVGPAAAQVGETIGGESEYDDPKDPTVVTGIKREPQVARGIGQAVGLIVSASPRNIVGPVASKAGGAVATVAERIGIPDALERSAGVSYRKMLTPTAKDVVPEAEAIAGGPSPNGPTGLVKTRPVALTRSGMAGKMRDAMAESGPQTGTIYDNKPPLDPQPILDHLEQVRQQKAVVKGTSVVSDPVLNDAIDELKQNIEDMRGPDGKVPAVSLDDFKDKLNRGNVSPRGHMRLLAPQTAASIEKSVAGRIGGYLDATYPDAAAVNATYRTARHTNDFLEEQRRAEIAAQSGVRTGSSSGFGAALKKSIPAPLRGIPNALAAITDSVAWDSVSGATKARIAELIRNKAWARAQSEVVRLPQIPKQPLDSLIRQYGADGQEVVPDSKPAGPEWWAQQPETAAEREAAATQRYGQLFDQADKIAANRARTAPEVPSSGIPEGVARGVDARGSLTRQLLGGRTWEQATAAERNAIDQMIAEGYGKAAPIKKYAKGGIIHRPTLLVDAETHKPTGLMAEAGPEAIVPLGGETAANPTVPEKPDAIAEQISQLTGLKRRVVMLPRGTFPHAAPEGMTTHADQHGNKFIFNPNLIGIHDIKLAIATNSLPRILGAARGGMGVPDKSKLSGKLTNVIAKSKGGLSIQSAATDIPHIKGAIRQAKKITPKGGSVSVENPAIEIQRRMRI